MPKASRFFTVEASQISEIAIRIQSRMRKLGMSVSELSERCSVVAPELLEGEDCPSLSRPRIAKILMHRHGSSGRSAAKVITRSELIILAKALNVSVEWLSGQKDNEDPIVWNVLAEPERAGHLLHLLEEYEERASEITVWGEYLLCSFATEEFMHAFHAAHFGEMDTFGIGKDKPRLVDFFNKMGESRRRRVLRSDRKFTFTSLIYNSELKRIAHGTAVYRSIPLTVRKRCLKNLTDILTDASLKLKLVIVDDEKIGKIKTAIRDYETLGVVGEIFSMWNYHSGSIGWSEHPKYVGHHKKLISQMQHHAIAESNRDTAEYIKELSAGV